MSFNISVIGISKFTGKRPSSGPTPAFESRSRSKWVPGRRSFKWIVRGPLPNGKYGEDWEIFFLDGKELVLGW